MTNDLVELVNDTQKDIVTRRTSIFKELFNIAEHIGVEYTERLLDASKRYGSFKSVFDNYQDLMRWRDRVIFRDVAEKYNIMPFALYKQREE